MTREAMLPTTAAQRSELATAARFYAEDVLDDDEAMTYLSETRGLDMSTIMDFGLGIVREPIGFDHERFRGMICIPNHGGAADEHVVGLKFRALDPEASKKYDQPKGQIARLFNLRALNHVTDTIWATEGEFDAICLSQVGLPAIAVPGVNHWDKGHAFRSRMFDGLRVVLCPDSDEAAKALVGSMRKTLDVFIERGMNPHKDVNEFLLAEGPDALRDRAEGR